MTEKQLPRYLLKLDFMLKSVGFIALFSVMFMIVYSPFSISGWFDIFDGRHLPMTVAFYIVAIAVMVASKIAMASVNSRFAVTIPVYVLWLLGEVVVISLLYTGFTTILVFRGSFDGTLNLLFRAFCCSGAILAIPYIISSLYAAYKTKDEENEIMRYRARILGGEEENQASHLVNFFDGNGVLKLTIDIDALYYIESEDNYVKICYDVDGSLHNYMLRCRTRMIEEYLARTPMVRCHRSYIINSEKISVLHFDKSDRTVILKHPLIKPIPVSRTYSRRMQEIVSHNAGNE